MTGPTTDPTTVRWTSFGSPLGQLLLTADEFGALTSLSVPGQKGGRSIKPGWRQDPGPFRAVGDQLAAYFAGELKEFQLEFRTSGTDFRERVWAALDSAAVRRDDDVRRDRRADRSTPGRRAGRRRGRSAPTRCWWSAPATASSAPTEH